MERQWHIIGSPHVAEKLVHDVGFFMTQIKEAILVFDQGFWQPDHALWEAVQKVSPGLLRADSVLTSGFMEGRHPRRGVQEQSHRGLPLVLQVREDIQGSGGSLEAGPNLPRRE